MSGASVEPRSPRGIYLDHAATSWPKPEPVVAGVVRALIELGGNPGRGAHAMAIEASRAVFSARARCADYLGVSDPANIVFQASCTVACNLMLKGTLRRKDRVVVGSMEHNAIVRPLARMAAEHAVEVVVVQADRTGFVDPGDVEREVRSAPTRAVVCQHASNVTGTIQPIGELAEIAREYGALMLVDGAQGAGHVPIDLVAQRVHAYAFSGHKALLGPQGIGVLYVAPEVPLVELVEGGTGGGPSVSLAMPCERPDRYEAGTLNVPGIVGLGAGVEFRANLGEPRSLEERRLALMLHEGLLDLPGFRVLGPPAGVPRVPLVSAVHAGIHSDRIAFELERTHGIAARAGIHCSPWAHETTGTSESGALRLSVGWDTTEEEVEAVIRALSEVVA